MSRTDIIVIGGGLNSLVAAALLGQSGKNVTLLEVRGHIAGLSSTEEFAP